jgi:hypothetical protein
MMMFQMDGVESSEDIPALSEEGGGGHRHSPVVWAHPDPSPPPWRYHLYNPDSAGHQRDPYEQFEEALLHMPFLSMDDRAIASLMIRMKEAPDDDVIVISTYSIVVQHLLSKYALETGNIIRWTMQWRGFYYFATPPLKYLLKKLVPNHYVPVTRFTVSPDPEPLPLPTPPPKTNPSQHSSPSKKRTGVVSSDFAAASPPRKGPLLRRQVLKTSSESPTTTIGHTPKSTRSSDPGTPYQLMPCRLEALQENDPHLAIIHSTSTESASIRLQRSASLGSGQKALPTQV